MALGLVAGLAACQPSASNAVELGQSPAGLEQVPLTITSSGREHRFTVEVANTVEQQAMGLMYRNMLAPDRGMIFPFDPPRGASFWMRNTLIPLDMMFIRADKTIAGIVENAEPRTETLRRVGLPSRYVLEVNGGFSAARGIKAGARVRFVNVRE